MTLAVPQTVPRVHWRDFYAYFARIWEQGEHVSLIGHTGSGKTTLGIHVLSLRRDVVAFGTKPYDSTMNLLLTNGYMLEREWVPELGTHLVLWPKFKALGENKHQREIFLNALNGGLRSRGWTVFLDEVSHLTDDLKMDRELRELWQQSRASAVSVVAGTQRPALVPLAMYEMASHLFIWRMRLDRDIARISGLAGEEHYELIRNLEKHEFLYINMRNGDLFRSKVER